MRYATAELCDRWGDKLQVLQPMMRDFGGRLTFHGPISTVQVHEDNALVRQALEGPGEGRVLVIDGGGSLRCALIGDRLAHLGVENGWSGVVINGCVRDTEALADLAFGVKALAAHPRASGKRGNGTREVAVRFGDTLFSPGAWLYADCDGVVVSPESL